jgi:tRNA pseudouridine32 synthase/23S rRNA pseudouridine746 synthase
MFWIGESPQGEVRHDGHYYPACSGKCKPILQWMLPPEVTADDSERRFTMADLPVVYEDQDLIVVDKPSGMLSVPGKTAVSSVVELLDAHFGNSARALSVHRLDQATSGLLVVAKHPDAQRELQRMFENRMVEKRYLALIEGNLPADTPHEGTIDLPLRPDLDDRPRQLVDPDNGKEAVTEYELLSRTDARVRLLLTPHTGRTHQLRVHCAHTDGLAVPILGDELYGTKSTRLHLHASSLCFTHPRTGERLSFRSDPPF